MKVRKESVFIGDNKEDALEALKRVDSYINRRPCNKKIFRHVFICYTLTDRSEINISDGGYFGDLYMRPDFNKLFKEAQERLAEIDDIKRFYIAGSIEKE